MGATYTVGIKLHRTVRSSAWVPGIELLGPVLAGVAAQRRGGALQMQMHLSK